MPGPRPGSRLGNPATRGLREGLTSGLSRPNTVDGFDNGQAAGLDGTQMPGSQQPPRGQEAGGLSEREANVAERERRLAQREAALDERVAVGREERLKALTASIVADNEYLRENPGDLVRRELAKANQWELRTLFNSGAGSRPATRA